MATLLVTNDFPPTVGGIQSYLRDFANEFVRLRGPESLVVFASTQDAHEASLYDATLPYTVHRLPAKMMLPTPATVRRMQELIEQHGITTVWFGAAAPLAVMAPAARRAGARTIVATTHGHEVGWSTLPGARQVLRLIGNAADTVTYISEYTLRRFRSAFGGHPAFVPLPSGVDTDFFRPATSEQRAAARDRYGFGSAPLVVVASRLVPRKGQDRLIECWPAVRDAVPGATLAVVGEGRYEPRLKQLARRHGVEDAVRFLGRLPREDMRDVVAAADVMAMPARTRGGGLDVEGLGIVYLEAQACGVPVIAGQSGGAPETVTAETGMVVDGTDNTAITAAVIDLLRNPQQRAAMGAAGRKFVGERFSWTVLVERLADVLEDRSDRGGATGGI